MMEENNDSNGNGNGEQINNEETIIEKIDDLIINTELQQQQSSISKNDNNNNNGEQQENIESRDNSYINIDKTLLKVKDIKQKEREERLASMMGHYHKKYSSPTLDADGNEVAVVEDDGDNSYNSMLDDEDMTPEELAASIQRKQLRNQRKKDLLAEQMKKYNDQYQNLISDVNSILSSPSPISGSSNSNTSSTITSPNQSFPPSPVFMSQQQQQQQQSSDTLDNFTNNTSTTSTSTISTNEFKPIPIISMKQQQHNQQQQQQNLLPNPDSNSTISTSTSTTTNTSTTTTTTTNNDHRPPQDANRILYFETQDIPYLSNVGFNTLKSIEMDAIRCAETVVSLTRNLNYSLLVMSRMSVELFNTYKMSNDMTCQSITQSITDASNLIDKCTELNDQTKTLVQLQQRIKSIKECVDKFDTIVHNAVKQLDIKPR